MLVSINNLLNYISSDSTPALTHRDIVLLKSLIDEVEGFVSSYVGYEINKHDVVDILNPRRSNIVFLTELAININHVYFDTAKDFGSDTEITDEIEFDQKLNAIRKKQGLWNVNCNCIKVDYTAGWDQSDAPSDLKSVIEAVAANLFDKVRKRLTDVVSHAGLGSSVTYPVEKFILPHHYTILDRYRIPAL